MAAAPTCASKTNSHKGSIVPPPEVDPAVPPVDSLCVCSAMPLPSPDAGVDTVASLAEVELALPATIRANQCRSFFASRYVPVIDASELMLSADVSNGEAFPIGSSITVISPLTARTNAC